jgi:hypothetical protein
MIIIQTSVWRADCIAAIRYDEGTEISILPIISHGGCDQWSDYDFDNEEIALSAYKDIVYKWTDELKEGKGK